MTTVAKGRILVTRFPMNSRLGGTCVHTLELMHALDKRGYEVFFLGSCHVMKRLFERCGFETKKAWMCKPPVKATAKLCFLGLWPVLFLLAGWHLWRAKKRWNVDTVYMISLGAKLLMSFWAKVFGMKVVWMEHHWPKTELRGGLWKNWLRRASRGVKVVVPSVRMKDAVSSILGEVTLIPWGIHEGKKEALSKEIVDFMNGHFCLVSVCRLSVDKGVDRMVKLVHSKPDTKLILVGDGPLREEVKKAVTDGQVLWLPSLSRGELNSLYHAMDAFLFLPRVEEAFGFVAAEAMLAGKPVIMTQKCALSSELHNGKEALIVPARFSSIDKALKKLMKSEKLRAEVGAAGARHIEKYHKSSDMVRAFDELFQESV